MKHYSKSDFCCYLFRTVLLLLVLESSEMETNLDLLINIVDFTISLVFSCKYSFYLKSVSQLASFSSPFHCKLNIQLKDCLGSSSVLVCCLKEPACFDLLDLKKHPFFNMKTVIPWGWKDSRVGESTRGLRFTPSTHAGCGWAALSHL